MQRAAHEIQAVGVRWNTWGIMASRDDKLSDALSPRYLWNKHADMQPGDTIEIKHPLMKWVVVLDLILYRCRRTRPRLPFATFTTTPRRPYWWRRHCRRPRSTGSVIAAGRSSMADTLPGRFSEQESAEAWLNDMLEAA